MNLIVLSACYERPDLASILRESCELFHLPLGFCEAKELNGVWPTSGDMRVGKLQAAYEQLLLIKESNAFSHVLWADGFDTFMQARHGKIEAEWHGLGCPPLILSAEKNCWPDSEKAAEYPEVEGEYRFINAGTWMGHVGYLVDVIGKMLASPWPGGNDQRAWTDAFLGGLLPGAVIDSQRLIFQTMWGATEEELASANPCVVHYNGGIWRNPEDKRYIDHWTRVKAVCER